MPGEELHEILREIDTNMNGQVELDEYLQVCESSHARICRIVLQPLSNFFFPQISFVALFYIYIYISFNIT